MKICLAQTKPIKGDVQSNIANHKKFVEIAVSNRTDIIIFPELSLTGYEPSLAKDLATTKEDQRFDVFQKISNSNNIIIGVGMPIHSNVGITISMILFQPNKERALYSKKYLHPDEEQYFISGDNSISLKIKGNNISFAICYEISIPEHSEYAHKNGTDIYIASVAKSIEGIEKAVQSLPDIAKNFSMTVLMPNCVGYCDNFECGGKSSVWNNNGLMVGQLNETEEGLFIFDTETQSVSQMRI